MIFSSLFKGFCGVNDDSMSRGFVVVVVVVVVAAAGGAAVL